MCEKKKKEKKENNLKKNLVIGFKRSLHGLSIVSPQLSRFLSDKIELIYKADLLETSIGSLIHPGR